jgi:hypothetical protein
MKNAYYSYDITKVINIVLFVIHSFGNKIHLLLLHKLLYSADILHLVRYGYLITRDRYILMKNSLLPVNTYFLYNKLVEENNWFTLPYNIHEFFFIDGNFVYCHQTYNSDLLSGSEVSCLFETIQAYKKNGKAFLKITSGYNTSTGNTLFNELSLFNLVITNGINNSMHNYIAECMQAEIFRGSNYQLSNVKEANKLSALSSVAIGTVLKGDDAENIYIVVGISLLKYMLVKNLSTDNIVVAEFFDDLKKSFITLNHSYDFLSAESYINCSQLHSISHDQLYKRIASDAEVLLGQICIGDMETIISTLHDSATLAANIKEGLVVYV